MTQFSTQNSSSILSSKNRSSLNDFSFSLHCDPPHVTLLLLNMGVGGGVPALCLEGGMVEIHRNQTRGCKGRSDTSDNTEELDGQTGGGGKILRWWGRVGWGVLHLCRSRREKEGNGGRGRRWRRRRRRRREGCCL